MKQHPPDPESVERLATATRRVIDLVRRSEATKETAEQAITFLERASALLEDSAHPGPWHQRSLVFEGFGEFHQESPTDFADFFPYSPLVGPRNPVAPPAVFEIRGERVVGHVRFGAAYTGPPTCVHGGVIAALFDEILGSTNVANGVGGMTGTLEIVYRKPTPIDEDLHFEGWIDRREGRKVFTRGTLHHGDTLTAEAEGIFIMGSMQHLAGRMAAAAGAAAD